MFLPSYKESGDAIFSFAELKELSGEVDAPTTIFLFVLWPSAPFFEEVLIGGIPVDNAVAEEDTGAVIQPGSCFFIFEMGVGTI